MSDGWSSLASLIEKSDIIEHYGNPVMPMQLRTLGAGRTERGFHDGDSDDGRTRGYTYGAARGGLYVQSCLSKPLLRSQRSLCSVFPNALLGRFVVKAR